MDYWPNVDAVQWFATDIFPPLRERFTGLKFYIVGSRPAPAVQELAKLPGVVVTGTVPDVRPYIAHAAVSVAPLRIARGIQNKVLEAMAMATPVVVSPQALEGIDAVPGSELVLAEDAAAFVDAVSTLLAGQDSAAAAIGAAARAKVQRRYSWSSNLACIGESLECS
jgi:glycosyltransferase involved in cell wall biosynthesis